MVFTYILYGFMNLFLMISWYKDKKKTRKALKKAWKSFENILPQFMTVLLIIGMLLALLDQELISKILGNQSGIIGLSIAAVVGSITLIPGFVAFPLAASLLQQGAGYGQITMFVTTLMMVGIVTLPVEMNYFGKGTTIKRNAVSFIYAVIISLIIGGIL